MKTKKITSIILSIFILCASAVSASALEYTAKEAKLKGFNYILDAQAVTKKQTIKQKVTTPTGSITPTEPSEEVTDNSLFGKFIYTDGDSITKGAKIGIDPIMGTRPTYAALTADRNQANYLTNAISGTTMGCINANGKEYQGFASTTYKRYKKAPANVDYITLWFGWNDSSLGRVMHKEKWLKKKYGKTIYYPRFSYQIGKKGFATKKQMAACDKVKGYVNGVKYTGNRYFYMKYLGNENSTDKRTFWGAYNNVLNYLTTSPKYKNTKIGIVVPYGTTEMMRDAVRKIAKKHNVACLDLYDDNLPLFFGKEPTNTSVTEKMCAANQAKYLADGIHPNEDGHELLSYVYESWLKTI